MDYVRDDVAKLCRNWEDKFKALPAQAGVLFVSVTAKPSQKGGDGHYHIVLGLSREFSMDESTGIAIVNKVLVDELQSHLYEISASVYIGR